MLYVIQKGYNMVVPTPPENIVYCVSSVQHILEQDLDFVFTDGHAVNGFSLQYTIKDIHNIDTIIDKKAIETKYWIDENDLDIKRRKEAEFLVLGDISKEAILGFITYNQQTKNKIISFGGDSTKVFVKSEYYF